MSNSFIVIAMMKAYLQNKLTLTLIVLCTIVAVLSQLGANQAIVKPFFISNFPPAAHMPEIQQGAYWRLITPLFLHFSILHFVFNMLWIWDLGRTIERGQSLWHLLLLVIVIGGLSNISQYYVAGPNFGGMSGVVYGLLAYIWIQGKLNPRSGLFVQKQIVIFVMLWYVLCWTGLFGPIANIAHTAGLVLGLLAGLLFIAYEKNLKPKQL